jgi:hypothetical protein
MILHGLSDFYGNIAIVVFPGFILYWLLFAKLNLNKYQLATAIEQNRLLGIDNLWYR